MDTREHDLEKGLMEQRTFVGIEGGQTQCRVDGTAFSMDGGQQWRRRAVVSGIS